MNNKITKNKQKRLIDSKEFALNVALSIFMFIILQNLLNFVISNTGYQFNGMNLLTAFIISAVIFGLLTIVKR